MDSARQACAQPRGPLPLGLGRELRVAGREPSSQVLEDVEGRQLTRGDDDTFHRKDSVAMKYTSAGRQSTAVGGGGAPGERPDSCAPLLPDLLLQLPDLP